MVDINFEYVNPFIQAAKIVLKEFSQIDAETEAAYLKKPEHEGASFAVIIGVTGDLRGQVIFTMDVEAACYIATKMIMEEPVTELNEMSKSAVGEMANMILGNAATIFSNNNYTVDITPPTVMLGRNISFAVGDSRIVCVPLSFYKHTLELNIAVVEEG